MPSVQAANNNNQTEIHTSKDSKTTSNNQLNVNTGGQKTPSEQPEYIKQVQIMIEKKVRNLEKRRQKLEEYEASQRKGETLNEDQLAAVSKYGEVKSSLELVKDLDKQLVTLANDTMKQLKKQAKKEQLEREEGIKEKLREVERIKSLLNTLSQETVRNDFLEGRNGAVQLTRDELNLFDEFNKLVSPSGLFKAAENEVNESVDHLFNLVDNKNKSVLTTTYNELRKLFDRVMTSSYWTQEPEKPQDIQQSQPVEQVPAQQQQQQQQVETTETEQKTHTYQQHNTSTEDYVIVTSQEVENTHIQQSQQQQQQVPSQDQGTFFTTLNSENKFDNNNEEINFLQDSEIPQHGGQYSEQHEQQENLNVQEQHQQHYNNNQGHYGKPRHYNNDGNYQPRNNGNGPRRPYVSDNERRGGGRGGFQGGRGAPQGGRGGFHSGGRGGGNYRGGKPRGGPPSGNSFRNNNQPESRNENH